MEFEHPPDSAYTTSTNSERFAAMVDYAHGVIDEVSELSDVDWPNGECEIDFPWLTDLADGPTIRLTPANGVPLVVGP